MVMMKKRVKRAKPRARKPRKTSVSLAVKRYVKRAIHVDQENKVANYNPAVINMGSVANSTNMYMRPLLPYVGYNGDHPTPPPLPKGKGNRLHCPAGSYGAISYAGHEPRSDDLWSQNILYNFKTFYYDIWSKF